MLTDLQIEKLPAPAARREVPDGKVAGLYLVVQPSGAKSWALRYRVVGAPKKFTIGPYPAISLAAARKRAQNALAEVVDGVDPSAQKRAAREAEKAANSAADRVENVVDAYVKNYLSKKAKPSWAKEAERLLRVEVLPKFGKKRLGEITGDNVHRLLRILPSARRSPRIGHLPSSGSSVTGRCLATAARSLRPRLAMAWRRRRPRIPESVS
jgi:hypothetical protein